MKKCTECGETKPLSQFHKNAASGDGLRPNCKSCRSEQSKLYRDQNKEKIRAQKNQDYQANKERWQQHSRKAHLKRTYGLSLEEYQELLEKQDYCCAVCKRHQDEFKQNLAVDHSHKTGEIRGLLCNHCNRRVIGKHTDPELFRHAWEYLAGVYTGFFVPSKKKRRRKSAKST